MFDKSPYKVESPKETAVQVQEITPSEVHEIDECSEVRFKKGDSLFCNSFVTNGSEQIKAKLNLGLKLNNPGGFALNGLKVIPKLAARSNQGANQ